MYRQGNRHAGTAGQPTTIANPQFVASKLHWLNLVNNPHCSQSCCALSTVPAATGGPARWVLTW